jgi:DUF438 domain-containing protein
MRLEPGGRLDDLLKAYPFLLEFLAGLSPKFAKLRNPVLRKTVGRLATLQQVAGLGDMEVDKLLAAIGAEIRRVTGEELRPEAAAGAAPTPFRDRDARLEVLKDIIRDLHAGEDIDVLHRRFAELVKDLGPTEIPEMEQRLIEEGMPESEIKRLCDVHVQVFQASLDTQPPPQTLPGHPLHTLMAENRALEERLLDFESHLAALKAAPPMDFPRDLREGLLARWDALGEIEKHYLKKENQLFPLLEDRNVSGPSKVMWAIHDDVRAHWKELGGYLREGKRDEALAMARQVMTEIRDMISKEEKILFPMTLEVLTEADWARVKNGEEVVGYAWITPGAEWKPAAAPSAPPTAGGGYARPAAAIALDTGALTPEIINLVLKHLPLDVSFVDEDDTVRYYSDSAERIFSRSPAIIGRKVQNCHPPASVHVVEKILRSFKDGTRDTAEFWITLRGKFIHIRYIAVRGPDRAYRGCLEVSQDVTAIRTLGGQKRLLDGE